MLLSNLLGHLLEVEVLTEMTKDQLPAIPLCLLQELDGYVSWSDGAGFVSADLVREFQVLADLEGSHACLADLLEDVCEVVHVLDFGAHYVRGRNTRPTRGGVKKVGGAREVGGAKRGTGGGERRRKWRDKKKKRDGRGKI